MLKKFFPIFVLFFFIKFCRFQKLLDVDIHSSDYTALEARGFWFHSPCRFKIVGLKIPDEITYNGTDKFWVLKFSSTPPTWTVWTSIYTNLVCSAAVTQGTLLSVDIDISSNDIIGIFGQRGEFYASYSPTYNYSTFINGNPVLLRRLITDDIIGDCSSQVCDHDLNSMGRVLVFYEVCNDTNCKSCPVISICEECVDGYFEQGGSCQQCASNCEICTSLSSCTQCSRGWYESSGSCVDCKTNCAECTTGNDCQECDSGYYIYPVNSCTNSCPLGTYPDSTSPASCQGCESHCTECQSELNCDACEDEYYLFLDNCYSCDDHNSDCLYCDSSSCTECDPGYFLHILVDDECYSNCPSRGSYYNDVTTTPDTCQPCEANCDECSSSTLCTNCDNGYYLSGNDCIDCENNCVECTSTTWCTLCDNGFFLNNGDCIDCENNCLECTSNSVCTYCENGFYLYDQDCYSNCNTLGSFYNDQMTTPPSCSPCIQDCESCSGGTTCDACVNGYYVHNGGCEDDCTTLSGYFNDDSAQPPKCTQCGSNCNSCTSQVLCTECHPGGFYLHSGFCVSDCNVYDGYFNDDSAQPPKCSECESNCLHCTNPNNCFECRSSFYIYNNDCYAVCPDGTFLNSTSKCEDCLVNDCVHCEEESTCFDCGNFYLNGDDECVEDCTTLGGFFHNNSGLYGKCGECGSNCNGCDSPLNCISCINPYLNENGICLEECSQGFSIEEIDGMMYCVSICGIGCLVCINEDICEVCDEILYNKNGECVLVCGEGFFEDETENECVECYVGCSVCSSEIECTECSDGYELENNECSIVASPKPSGAGWVVPVILVILCFICVVIIIITLVLVITKREKIGNAIRDFKAFKKLNNVNVLLQEQEADKISVEDGNIIPTLKVNKDLYTINFDGIKLLDSIGSGGSGS